MFHEIETLSTEYKRRCRSPSVALIKDWVSGSDALSFLVFPDGRHFFRLLQWLKHLNLFKKRNDRSENSIRKQRTITRVYLVLLTGTVIV